MRLTAILTPAEDCGFVAFNPETGTTSQEESLREAMDNLREATSLYLEDFPLEPSVLLPTFYGCHPKTDTLRA